MGAADIVPGVSGGTVALVLGHYKRLISAISHIDTTALDHLRQRQFVAAWQHIDGRFLLALGLGILVGIGGLASLMHWLLEHRFPETMAVFFGLVLASGLLVARFVERWTPGAALMMVIGAVSAWTIASMSPVAGEPSTLYLFFCATIAICAMILPGISGAFVLLLLGAYHSVTGMIKQFVGLEISVDIIVKLTVFGVGCILGLAVFSRVLKYLLDRHASLTFAGLLGLMLGSLRKLYPLQLPTNETASLEFKERQYQMVSPGEWPESSTSLLVLAALILASAAAVLVLNRFATTRKLVPPTEDSPQ